VTAVCGRLETAYLTLQENADFGSDVRRSAIAIIAATSRARKSTAAAFIALA
jgi:hypothetical protein